MVMLFMLTRSDWVMGVIHDIDYELAWREFK